MHAKSEVVLLRHLSHCALRLHRSRHLSQRSSQMFLETTVLLMVLLPTLRFQKAFASSWMSATALVLPLPLRVKLSVSAGSAYPLVHRQEG